MTPDHKFSTVHPHSSDGTQLCTFLYTLDYRSTCFGKWPTKKKKKALSSREKLVYFIRINCTAPTRLTKSGTGWPFHPALTFSLPASHFRFLALSRLPLVSLTLFPISHCFLLSSVVLSHPALFPLLLSSHSPSSLLYHTPCHFLSCTLSLTFSFLLSPTKLIMVLAIFDYKRMDEKQDGHFCSTDITSTYAKNLFFFFFFFEQRWLKGERRTAKDEYKYYRFIGKRV